MLRAWMESEEIRLLETFLRKAGTYFEFGLGGTTVMAAELVAEEIWGVDSDRSYIDRVRTEIGERNDKALNLVHVDIGPTGIWGFPTTKDVGEKFAAYSLSILKAPCERIDLCFVDGRFRVACFLQAIQALRADAIIGIHDYPGRPQYHVIEKFARPISVARNLALFVARPDVDRAALKKCLDEYRSQPD